MIHAVKIEEKNRFLIRVNSGKQNEPENVAVERELYAENNFY